ncbi:MAG: hypothetical protein K8U03_22200 [Planctomycetia bacterium]|nr:hypothetical protein [Planctomycetia bacterium]
MKVYPFASSEVHRGYVLHHSPAALLVEIVTATAAESKKRTVATPCCGAPERPHISKDL